MTSEVYSVAEKRSAGIKGNGGQIYLRPGYYTERQLLFYIQKLHQENNPRPQVVTKGDPGQQPVVLEEAPAVEIQVEEIPVSKPEPQVEPFLFDRIVTFITNIFSK